MAEQKNRSLFLHSFIYEVNRATASLLYLLQGMEEVRRQEIPPYDAFPSHLQFSFPSSASPPGIDVPLVLGGKTFDPHEVLDPRGEAEQLAYKGWVVHVYDQIWEANFRNHFGDGFEGDDLIRPLSQPFGDFGHIRNDLVHNKGIAKATEAGRCKILTWFNSGDRMTLGMHHVFDFLNQIGFLNAVGGFVSSGAHASWSSIHLKESDLNREMIPKLVSCRGSLHRELDDGTADYVMALVFENGVYFSLPISVESSRRSSFECFDFVSKFRIDDEGNLLLPNGETRDRETLYSQGVDALLNPKPIQERAPEYGPWYQFRKTP